MIDDKQLLYYREVDEDNDQNLLNHFHYINEIILCHKGKAIITINNKKYEFSKGDILFVGSLENHSVEIVESPYDRSVLLMSTEFIAKQISNPIILSLISYHSPKFPYVFKLNTDLYKFIQDGFNQLENEFNNKETFWMESIASQITHLLITFCRRYPELTNQLSDRIHNREIIEVQQYLNKYYNKNINLDRLAAIFFTSVSSLSREFKKVTGYTINNYIILNRLQTAKNLLSSTEMDINDIANEIGYDNPSHFSRIFKRYNNINPTDFRKQAQEQIDKEL